MKQIFILLLISLLASSCIEELDEQERTFEKIYGFNSFSFPEGIIQLNNGSYLIYGFGARTIMDFDGQGQILGSSIEPRMPMLINIDQNGNEIFTRTFPIDSVHYEYNQGADSYNLKMVRGSFNSIIKLSTGKYAAKFSVDNGWDWVVHGFMILDENFNVEKIQILEDFEEEFQITPYVSRGDHVAYNSSNENEFLLLAKQSLYLNPNFWPKWETGFYSIFKLSLNGLLLNLYDYSRDDRPLLAADLSIDSNGNAIVIGFVNYSFNNLFIHRIDLQTGEILKKVELDINHANAGRPKILSTEEGYDLGYVEEVESKRTLAIDFLDKDFNVINHISLPPMPADKWETYLRSFILMKEGGFATLSYANNGSVIIRRIDNFGNELWRWEKEQPTIDGKLVGSLIETSDGGIFFVRGKDFNSTGHKMKLIKLDANGNL